MTAEAIRPTRRNLFVPLEEPVAAVTAAAVVSDDRREASQDKAWRMVLGFFLLTGGLIVAGGSPLVRYGYPAGSVILAFWLFRKAPVTYLSFVWWLSFLSPFIRRVVDYESGWHDPSPVLLAPQLAILVSAGSLLAGWSVWKKFTTLPFILAFASVAYGVTIGLLSLPAVPVLIATLAWIGPLLLGFHVYTESQNPRYAARCAETLQRTFLWGVLLMGAYGIYQLVVAPLWDQQWIVNSELVTVGQPEPFEIRVFSTMNAPSVLSATLAAGLLLLLVRRGVMPFIAAVAGYAALLLSLSRTGWLVWLAGMVVLSLRHRALAIRIGVMAIILVACTTVLSSFDPVKDIIQGRIRSFSSLQDDTSYEERRFGYALIPSYILAEPVGGGIGVMDLKYTGHPVSLGPHDSTIWELFMSIGWFGATAYLAALVLVFVQLVGKRSLSLFDAAANAVCMGMLSQFLLTSVMAGIPALCIWMFYGLCMREKETPQMSVITSE